MNNATSFDQWQNIALRLDEHLGNDIWRKSHPNKLYDFKLIDDRLCAMQDSMGDRDSDTLISLLRAGLVRNLGNITSLKLFNQAFGGTKILIDEYVTQTALAIEYLSSLSTSPSGETNWTPQAKMDFMHDTRLAFGSTSLVLQGGAIFGLSHFGVVKALHLQGLLPRIITGTATGALIAALVCVHDDRELSQFLTSNGIDLTAFTKRKRNRAPRQQRNDDSLLSNRNTDIVATIDRRIRRYFREGFFLDVNILESCARANVGDITFEEAYYKTRRVLNITVSDAGGAGVVLNYITAPNVLIWSAAIASNTSSNSMYKPARTYCKDYDGEIVPWQGLKAPSRQETISRKARDSPLNRVRQLFNVNHFIISQARPYIAPFLRSELHHPKPRMSAGPTKVLSRCFKMLANEIHHRLSQLDMFGLLSPAARRLLLDETIPGAHITLVPDITVGDFSKLWETPTKEDLDYWILRGERAVWPAVSALNVRCAIEVMLDQGYELMRTKLPEITENGGDRAVITGGKGDAITGST